MAWWFEKQTRDIYFWHRFLVAIMNFSREALLVYGKYTLFL